MAKKKYETQFSIYKVDYERAVKYFDAEYDLKITSYTELENQILKTIKEEVLQKKKNEIVSFSNNGFNGLVFKTYHYPSWYGMIDNMLEEDIGLSNTHISYVLSYLKDDNIFLLTGGLGSNYISEYTQRNYGLYLLPKIMQENSAAIKSVLENRMSGNKLSSKHSNRNVTTISTENEMIEIDKKISDILLNDDTSLTEDAYNKTFKESDDIILAHTVLSNNIELADLIYYDDDNLYLIHNKLKFQENGARDVLNQILTSAEFISHYMMEKKTFIEKYYEDILEKYPNNKIKDISKDEFIALFDKTNVYYAAGFMHNLSDSTDSNYAKYITIDTSKKLNEKGYQLLLFNING